MDIPKIAPLFLEENILIGGGACFFYKQTLAKAKDRDFPPLPEADEDRYLWLSKDIDFIGTRKDQIPAELGIEPDISGKCHVRGTWIDSPDAALTFTFEMAKSTAIPARVDSSGLDFFAISPALLLREKRVLLADPTKNRPQDVLHASTLAQATKLLLCQWLEAPSLDKERIKAWKLLANETKEYAPDLLEDPCVIRRLRTAAEPLREHPVAKSAWHWIEHKVPKEPLPAAQEMAKKPPNPPRLDSLRSTTPPPKGGPSGDFPRIL